MEFFKIHKDIPFMRHALIFNMISVVVFLLSVFFLFSRGLNLSVEFTGGTVMEVNYAQPADLNNIRSATTKLGYHDVEVQNFGNARDVMIRLPTEKVSLQRNRASRSCGPEGGRCQRCAAQFGVRGAQVGEELVTNGLKAWRWWSRAS
jgi:protein translocase subunit secF